MAVSGLASARVRPCVCPAQAFAPRALIGWWPADLSPMGDGRGQRAIWSMVDWWFTNYHCYVSTDSVSCYLLLFGLVLKAKVL